MEDKELEVFFGAAGSGVAYCYHTKEIPNLFVDNDPDKWGTFVNGIEVMSPDILSTVLIKRVVITSGYVKDIFPQILNLGVEENKIYSPPKSLLGMHPFSQEGNRIESAIKLNEIMTEFQDRWSIVSVGGTALGFVRDGDFIHWDPDMDLFAPFESREPLYNYLQIHGFNPVYELDSIKAVLYISDGSEVPFSIDFYDWNSETFLDRFEDYTWTWPTTMFTECKKVEIHGKMMNVPNPPNEYLSKVFGKTWSIPNPNFGYSDYAGEIS